MVTYETIALDEAVERNLPNIDQYEGLVLEWSWGIWRCEDGVPVEYIGEDGGEPEDQSLIRDWSWVAPALQEAYNLGKMDGWVRPK